MNKLLVILIALFTWMPTIGWADSYNTLWKRYAELESKDLPQDELIILNQIAKKARTELKYGHLLKAEFKLGQVKASISEDSIPVVLKRLESEVAKAEKENDVLAAVYQCALGKVYADLNIPGVDCAALSKSWFEKAMRHPDKLAAVNADNYEPLLTKGTDSHIFYNDLLHVIGYETGDFKTMYQWYSAHNNRSAACLCAFEITQQDRKADVMEVRKSKYLQTIDSLINVYKDLPVAGELAIERYNFMDKATDATTADKYNYINYALSRWGTWHRMNILRNAQKRLTLPDFIADMGVNVLLSHHPRTIYIRQLTNIQQLTMTVTRLNVAHFTEFNPNVSNDYAKINKLLEQNPTQTVTHRYVGLPPYKSESDSMVIEGLAPGEYMVELLTDNKDIKPERMMLHVTDMFAFARPLPDDKMRLIALNSATGQPVAGAHIKLSEYDWNSRKRTEIVTLTTDQNGEAVYKGGKEPDQMEVFTENDKFCPPFEINDNVSFYHSDNKYEPVTKIFTDRSLFRPGQTVKVSVLAFNMRQKDRDTKVAAGKTIKLTLKDANYKTQGEKTVTTDDFGMASTEFVLPRTGLTGTFQITGEANERCTFRVEEYKRPTYNVAFTPYKEAYHSGDTITLEGTAKSFAGVPVAGATVKLNIQRKPRFYWRSMSNAQSYSFEPDTTVTDNQGKFTVRVPLFLPETKKGEAAYYNYHIEALVTDLSGESHTATTNLPLSNRTSIFSHNLADKLEKEHLGSFHFSYKNILEQELTSAVHYTIDGKSYQALSNLDIALDKLNLASGRHQLQAICGSDTLHHTFIIYSFKDKTAPIETHDWFIASSNSFPEDGSPVSVQFGSSDENMYIVYDIYAESKLVEQGHLRLNKEVQIRSFKYKPEYGDGIIVSMAWVRDGQCYTHQVYIEKPLPNKTLNMKWLTFRDRLTPGQEETWKLQITDPKGKAAKAQLMAVMYDKSLDEINPHNWTLSLPYYNRLPYIPKWQDTDFQSFTLYGEMPFNPLAESELNFTQIDPSATSWDNYFFLSTALQGRVNGIQPKRSYAVAGSVLEAKAVSPMELRAARAEKSKTKQLADSNEEEEEKAQENDSEQPKANAIAVRKNFNETAFFYPMLETDQQGNVTIRFTLPESVTTWKFIGMSHDRQMNFGFEKAVATAQKTVMVMPNMPRFVRLSDTPQLACRVVNTTAKVQSGKLTMQLINPENEQVVFTQSKRITLKEQETIGETFNFVPKEVMESSDGGLLVCRITVEGSDFSDGEQHYLPILSDKEKVINTVAFSQIGAGTKTIDTDQLFPVKEATNHLTIEYTNNPAWLMIKTLPSVAADNTKNAISQAVAFYTNSIAKSIISKSPKIAETIRQWTMTSKTDSKSPFESLNEELENSPWLQEALHEHDQQGQLINYLDDNNISYRLNNNLQQIKKLQNPNGSFSWWEKGPESLYITLSVCKILQRLNMLAGPQPQTTQILQKGMGYIETQMAKEIKELQRREKAGHKSLIPSDAAINYLYLCALRRQNQEKADYKYLLKLIEDHPAYLTIHGKATMAVILGRSGKTAKALQQLNSIKQYTVYKEEMGRYFDTKNAYYSWFDYKIPTQVAAIEALKLITPEDKTTITEMQRWLLQSKRTQQWDTPLNCVDAVYGFVDGNISTLTDNTAKPATLKLNGNPLTTTPAFPGTGFVQAQLSGNNFGTFTAENHADRVTWGAVYAEFTQNSTDIADAQMGLTVKREVIMPNETLKVGDKVKVRITITADRDYDFVEIADHRAACMEPVRQLSGYTQGCYYMLKDDSTYYYYDMLPKGTHTLETEYYIDKAGDYTTGTCTARCMYSPEYAGRNKALRLQVK